MLTTMKIPHAPNYIELCCTPSYVVEAQSCAIDLVTISQVDFSFEVNAALLPAKKQDLSLARQAPNSNDCDLRLRLA